MARSGFQATIGQSLGEGQYVVTAARGGAATVDTATLTAAIAAAQLIGAGDASAEIDAIDVAAQALSATNTGHVSVTYDTTAVTSLNQLKRAFERILLAAASAGMV